MNMLRKISAIAQFILVVIVLTFPAHAAGEVDTSFNPRLIDVASSTSSLIERTSVRRVVVQPDGKILASGYFNVVNNSVRDGIVRFNADGTVDPAFNPPVLTRAGSNPSVLTILALALQSDGKILIGGNFITSGAVIRQGIARLNTDGSVDASFNLNTLALDIEIAADGKIIICTTGQQGVMRVLPDGTVDATFNPQIPQTPSIFSAYDVAVQPDGKVLVSFRYSMGGGGIYRLNANGSIDFSRTISGGSSTVYRMFVQPDGKILLGGTFNMIDGFPMPNNISRLNADGTIDPTFNIGNAGASGNVNDIELLANGKILIGGGFESYNGVDRQNVAVINDDGSLDNSYNYTGRTLNVYDLAVQSDGKVVLGTPANSDQGVIYPPLARLNANGSLDSSIQPVMGNAGIVHKVLVQPDGKILTGGYYNHVNDVFRRNLARFNTDGTYDSSFLSAIFFFSPNQYITELDLQPDGKILVAGIISNAFRLNADGTQDMTISNTPNPPSIRYLPSGKLLKVGNEMARYSENGFFESQTARLNFEGVAYKAAIQADGKIIIVGTFTEINFTTPRNNIARLNADGTFDAAFDPPGGTNNRINDVVLQPDGKILIGGMFTSVNNNNNYKYLARLNADGTLDTNFNPVLNGQVTSLKLQPDGKILFGGAMTTVNGIQRRSMARVNPNGTLDTSFNLGSGTDGLIRSIDLQADSGIIIGGDFRRVNGVEKLGVARLLNSAAPQQKLFDYDGDGRADISVFRASENRWYIFRSSDLTVVEQVFAVPGDVPVPADFDGDGKTDVAVFRPSTGDWWYSSSINNAQIFAHWGQSGDIPRPSDFDGDGKADFVIFRPAENNWYRLGSTGAVSIVNFGSAADKPVTGDFDGDGKSDVAVFRPSTGTWWYRSSINSAQIATQFGVAGDTPAAADYDGDGKTDLAVYRPSTGVWYILNSSNGSFTILGFGLAEDKPAAADYDGDGKADIAVFRPSTGVWYLLRSTAGFAALQFGISTDTPTPNAFVP